MTAIPDLRALPLRRRARLEILAAAQRLLDGHASRAAALLERLPPALAESLRRLGAPARIPRPPGAEVPLSARPLAGLAAGPAAGRDAPEVSVLVVTYGQVAHTRLCLEALRAYTAPGRYEVVVVDHGSTDGTVEVLRAQAAAWPALRVSARERNPGFAAGINDAARQARGEVLVVLNNDTVVTPGWLEPLLAALADPTVGLAGPTTNDSGDVAVVPASYSDLDGLLAHAARRARARAGRRRGVAKLSLFCAAMRRQTFERLGGLDEAFGLGMFEDDDLCAALAARGLRVVLAEDAYVHHAAGATFRRLSPRDYLAWFEVNRLRYERKWNTRWHP